MIFKNVDKELEKIGFEKLLEGDKETKHGVYYRREVKKGEDNPRYIQRVDIYYKVSGRHLIISYEEGVNKDKLNNCVGLTYKELKLFIRKYKQMVRKYKWIKKET